MAEVAYGFARCSAQMSVSLDVVRLVLRGTDGLGRMVEAEQNLGLRFLIRRTLAVSIDLAFVAVPVCRSNELVI